MAYSRWGPISAPIRQAEAFDPEAWRAVLQAAVRYSPRLVWGPGRGQGRAGPSQDYTAHTAVARPIEQVGIADPVQEHTGSVLAVEVEIDRRIVAGWTGPVVGGHGTDWGSLLVVKDTETAVPLEGGTVEAGRVLEEELAVRIPA